MDILRLPIADLHLDRANARRHPERNMDALMASLMRFGQQKPIVIDGNNVVRAGNGTLAAAKGLGWKEIVCVRSDLPMSELAAYAVVDNRTAELAEWDPEMLRASLEGLDELDLKALGFDDAEELAKLCDEAVADLPGDVEAVMAVFEVVVECQDEGHQREVYERLTGEGERCRVLTI
jgi:ParB-like chromosome segregation protein Spo0J